MVRAMIDHIGIAVSDIDRSIAFYTKALAPLGYELIAKFDIPSGGTVAGFGVNKKPDFWIAKGNVIQHLHVAFRSPGRDVVRKFYEAAMAAGGKDNGPPGVRPHYHEHYYGGFVLDPDGHNVEACCHEPFLG
jgi:catechol 2,3-dioxygenase-like lactoylglutathione lyase family enzyme